MVNHLETSAGESLPAQLARLAAEIVRHDARGAAVRLSPCLVHLRDAFPASDAKAVVDAAVLVSRALFAHGRSVEALPLARELFDACRLAGDRPQARRAAVLCGLVAGDGGDVAGAIEHEVWALRDAAADEDRLGMARSWLNIGHAIAISGRYELAARCHRRSLALLEPMPGPLQVRYAALGNLADASYQVGEVEEGIRHGELALRELEGLSDQDAHGVVLLRRTMVRLLLARDRAGEAAEHLARAAALVEASPSPRAAIALEVMRAAYEMATGEADLALTRLERALGRAREMPATLHDALAWAVRAEEAAGNPARALVRLEELSSHVFHHAISRTRAMVEAAGIDPVEGIELRHETARERLQAMLEAPAPPASWAAMRRLAASAALRMDDTGCHGIRVGALVKALARASGSPPLQALELGLAAELHDIGMSAVPAAILAKRGPLNDAERELVRRHAEAGPAMLLEGQHPRVLLAREMSRYHHARWDGLGYPSPVAGPSIPLGARMCAVADAYDMMVTGFGGGRRLSLVGALEELRGEAGRQFDPGLVSCFDVLIRGELEGMGIDPASSPGLEDFQELVASLKDDRGFA